MRLPSFFGVSKIERTDLSSRVDELVFVPDDDEAEEDMRNYVSHLWAEDSVYDDYPPGETVMDDGAG